MSCYNTVFTTESLSIHGGKVKFAKA